MDEMRTRRLRNHAELRRKCTNFMQRPIETETSDKCMHLLP